MIGKSLLTRLKQIFVGYVTYKPPVEIVNGREEVDGWRGTHRRALYLGSTVEVQKICQRHIPATGSLQQAGRALRHRGCSNYQTMTTE